MARLRDKRILLIIGGGIAAYKALELARRLMDEGAAVTGILTKGGSEFITPLSVAGLTGNQCYTDLFDLKDEAEMGHIRLSREADMVLVAPATADLMAKMAAGMASDLATTVLLATDKPVMVAPAMNVQMWAHPANQRNLQTLKNDGISFVQPGDGLLACGEVGPGRLADVPDIADAVSAFLAPVGQRMADKHVLITAGPTHEAIDPVRYIANRSSGLQGFEIARAAAKAGARVSLIAGPTILETPAGVTRVDVESAREMASAVEAHLPADVAICVAAVADWHVADCSAEKLKKSVDGVPHLALVENPDILKGLAQRSAGRPELVVGFAAETNNVMKHAVAKRDRKGCDWIVANDVSTDKAVMGGLENTVILIKDSGMHPWEKMTKAGVANRLIGEISSFLEGNNT